MGKSKSKPEVERRSRHYADAERIRRIPVRWEVAHAYDGSPGFAHLLNDGWEPFSVTEVNGMLPRIWFRRQRWAGA